MSGRGAIRPFPDKRSGGVAKGSPRNFEIFDPLEFLAHVTQHIPDASQHLVRYCGWYSNRTRGKRRKAEEALAAQGRSPAPPPEPDPPDLAQLRMQARSRWAALIKKIYEVDPLVCTKCGGPMHIIAFLTDEAAVRRILKHLGHAPPPCEPAPGEDPPARAPPRPPTPFRPAVPWEHDFPADADFEY